MKNIITEAIIFSVLLMLVIILPSHEDKVEILLILICARVYVINIKGDQR